MAIEIYIYMIYPLKIVILHSFLYVYQRVQTIQPSFKPSNPTGVGSLVKIPMFKLQPVDLFWSIQWMKMVDLTIKLIGFNGIYIYIYK